jgi:arabinogalactan endo-1,4-beta-galactosidase
LEKKCNAASECTVLRYDWELFMEVSMRRVIWAAVVSAMVLGMGVRAAVPTAPAAPSSTGAAAPVPAEVREDYIVGADISWVQQREASGQRYGENGVQKDILEILKSHGFNYIRLRVFVDPTKATPSDRPYSTEGFCDLAHTIVMGKRVKAAGMKLLIDFHYSDAWADPGKQHVPAAWKELSNEELAKKVYEWTKDSVGQLVAAGCTPDMVQVGNEITPGMMTDHGGTANAAGWPVLGSYLKAGIKGVKEAAPKAVIMLHLDRGGDRTFNGQVGAANRTTRAWVDNAIAQGVEFDVLGLSCYERWQGPPAGWKANFEDLAQRYPKLKFVMAEVDAQAVQANDIMMGLPDKRGLGTFIWEPTADNAGQALFQQPVGRGGFGRGRGAAATTAATATAPATTSAATTPTTTSTAPATATAPAAGRGVLSVIPEKMAQYDQVVDKYKLKKLP